ncbi:MAG TPA: o-succinylbenzoate synthase, partial [Gemmatimonadales bacterium]|nr:o-succinylbenzoate synthase [Gemmatimonadales bacterium]
MRIARAELFELTLPLLEPFIISGGTITERRSLIVVLHDDAGHVGYGECPPFELPFYSEETLSSARDLITRVLLPR